MSSSGLSIRIETTPDYVASAKINVVDATGALPSHTLLTMEVFDQMANNATDRNVSGSAMSTTTTITSGCLQDYEARHTSMSTQVHSSVIA